MFYEPRKNNHGLAHDPFKSCVVPRPIGWISTIGADGVANLAPFSQFQNLTFDPPYVMFAANQKTDGHRKDSAVNAEQSGEFVYNMATYNLREAVNRSAVNVPPDVDEFELAGVTKAPSVRVAPSRVAGSSGSPGARLRPIACTFSSTASLTSSCNSSREPAEHISP